MRCSRCGNDNPGDNRFCGMCGATLLAPAPPVTAVPETATQRAASAGPNIPSPVVTAPSRPQEPPRPPTPPPAPAPRNEPTITGPSFLGLNDAPPRKRASLSIDPHQHGSSGNVDYLLEDDDEPKRGGAGKGIFILVVLAIVVGFGYLRWKNNGFTWGSTPAKPAATDQTPPADSSAASTPSSPAPSPSITPETAPAANSPVTQSAQPAAPAKTEAAPPAATTPDSAASKNDTKPEAPDKATSEADNSDDEEAATPPAKAEVPKPKPVPPKPTAAAKPVRAGDSVAEAQRYLYGKGVPQNCDRGLQLLKPEANKANPKAMIEMGALYSAGLCTPRDLPTAYRWFAQALRKDPDNQSVQTDLQKLWGEMTQPERQLAIKLSQ